MLNLTRKKNNKVFVILSLYRILMDDGDHSIDPIELDNFDQKVDEFFSKRSASGIFFIKRCKSLIFSIFNVINL